MARRMAALRSGRTCAGCGRRLGPGEVGPARRQLTAHVLIWIPPGFALLVLCSGERVLGSLDEVAGRGLLLAVGALTMFVMAVGLWLPRVRTLRCRSCGSTEEEQLRTRVSFRETLRDTMLVFLLFVGGRVGQALHRRWSRDGPRWRPRDPENPSG